MDACSLCDAVDRALARTEPRLVQEFETSVLLAGEHQYFRGYCLLVAKRHVRELHHLDGRHRDEFCSELAFVCAELERTFGPHKLNLSAFGNQVPHLHVHIMPRYAEDPGRFEQPWAFADRFGDQPTTDEDVAELRAVFATSPD